MDRISAIRNVEDALRAFESGEADLADTERRVAAVLRTYATEFEGDDDVFRATGEEPVDGRIVVAPSAPAARERVLALAGIDPSRDRERDAVSGASDANRPVDASDANRPVDASDANNPDDLTVLENDAVPEFEVERV